MSGFLLGAPTSLAAAAVALPGDRGARTPRSSPTLALLLSGGLHAAALTLFLLATARSGIEQVPTRAIRVIFDPKIVIRVAPPPAPPASAPGGRAWDKGVIEPVDKKLTVEDILEDLPGMKPEGPGPAGGSQADPGGPGTSGDLPGYAPPAESDPDLPSQYQEPPVPIVAPEPHYPEIEREAGIEGRVVIVALVARDGHVLQARIQEGERGLADEALKAVRVWKFRPARWNGKAVAAWVAIPVHFRLH